MLVQVTALSALAGVLLVLHPTPGHSQDPCPPYPRARGDWGRTYQEPDTAYLLNFPLIAGDTSIRVGADGVVWVYEGKLLAVRWERAGLTPERLAGFISAHRARLMGALSDSEPSRTTCVLQFPIPFGWRAMDSLVNVVRRWPGVLSAEPVRSGRAGRPLPADTARRR